MYQIHHTVKSAGNDFERDLSLLNLIHSPAINIKTAQKILPAKPVGINCDISII